MMENEQQELSAEQAAELAAMRAQAAENEPQAGELMPPEVDPVAKLGGELSGLILMVAGFLSPAFPSLSSIYTPETAGAAGGAVAAVCVKHGWLQDGAFAEWGEEIAAAAVLVPLGMATWQGVKADIEARKPKKETKPAAPGAAAVVAGTVPATDAAAAPAGVQFGAVQA